jgi:hypothetical protein
MSEASFVGVPPRTDTFITAPLSVRSSSVSQ